MQGGQSVEEEQPRNKFVSIPLFAVHAKFKRQVRARA